VFLNYSWLIKKTFGDFRFKNLRLLENAAAFRQPFLTVTAAAAA